MVNSVSNCPICQDPCDKAKPVHQLSCGHLGHKDCLQRLVNRAFAEKNAETADCPLCRREFTMIPTKKALDKMITRNIDLAYPLAIYNAMNGTAVELADLMRKPKLRDLVERVLEELPDRCITPDTATEIVEFELPGIARIFELRGDDIVNSPRFFKKVTVDVCRVLFPEEQLS